MLEDGLERLVLTLYPTYFQGNKDPIEPYYTIPDAIKTLTPNAKIIIILRDPVPRLLSHFLYDKNKHNSPLYKHPSALGFHEACVNSIKQYEVCFKKLGHRACAYDTSVMAETLLGLQIGMYSVFVRDWLAVFPRNQITFIKFEDYITNMVPVLEDLFSFLELDKMDRSEIIEKISSDRSIANRGKNYEDIPEMLNETRLMLQQFYSPFLAELRHLIGEQFYWNY